MDELGLILPYLPHWAMETIIGFLVVSYLCSEFCSHTHTPAPDTFYGRVYKLIEYIARIRGYAKEEGISIEKIKEIEGKKDE